MTSFSGGSSSLKSTRAKKCHNIDDVIFQLKKEHMEAIFEEQKIETSRRSSNLSKLMKLKQNAIIVKNVTSTKREMAMESITNI